MGPLYKFCGLPLHPAEQSFLGQVKSDRDVQDSFSAELNSTLEGQISTIEWKYFLQLIGLVISRNLCH
jgi:hypothetical protein